MKNKNGYKAFWGITLDDMTIYTSDENKKPVFFIKDSNDINQTLIKFFSLKNFGIY